MKEPYIYIDKEKARDLKNYYNRLCSYFTLLREEVREQIGIELSNGETLAFWEIEREEKEVIRPTFTNVHGLKVQKEFAIKYKFKSKGAITTTEDKICAEYASKAERAEAREKLEAIQATAKSRTNRPNICDYYTLNESDHDIKQIKLNKAAGRFEWAETLPDFIAERTNIKLTPKGEAARAAFEKAAKALQAVADLVENPQNGQFLQMFILDTNGKVHAPINFNYNEI